MIKKFSVYGILAVGFLLSIIAFWFSMENIKIKNHLRFETRVKESVIKVDARMDAYREILYSGAGLFNASDEVTKRDWHNFSHSLKLEKNFPGIQGFGYSKVLSKTKNANQEIVTSIVYLEPHNARNTRAMGYDMFSQITRREAMLQALNTQEAATSGKVRLLQENGVEEQAGFLIYLPFFKKGLPLDTKENRLKALEGFIYAPFRATDLMDGILGEGNSDISLEIYDNNKTEANLLFKIPQKDELSNDISEDVKLDVNGRIWILSYKPYISFLNKGKNNEPWFILALGITISFGFFFMVRSITKRRELSQKMADKMTDKYFHQQERLNNIIKGTHLGTWEWNIRTGETIFNDIWAEMLGYTLEEISPTTIQTWVDLTHHEDLVKSQKELHNHLTGKSDYYECEIRMQHKNGDWIWVLDRGKVMSLDENNHPLWMFGTHQDITDRKKLEFEIINERNFNSTIINNANSVIAVIDKTGTMVKLNKYGQYFTGYSEEEISSEPYLWSCLVPQMMKKELVTMVENFQYGTLVKNVKNSWISRDGEERMFLWSNTLVKTIDDSIDYILTVGIDITEQDKQNLLIAQQKEEFETIFKNSKDGIAILDLDMNYLDFNNAYLEMTGFEREELMTKSCKELTLNEDKTRSKEAFEKAIKDGFIENFEKTCMTKNGDSIIVNMSISLLPDHKRVLLSTRDITHNKFLQSQSKLASMGEMIGNIAHQWRQPLTVINILASSILFKKELNKLKDEELIGNMEQIEKQTVYLSKTIDDFKNFIKGDVEKHDINVNSLINKTLSIVNPTLKNSYIETIIDIDPKIEILGFESELMQGFINILNNSKDALLEHCASEDKYIFIETKIMNNQLQIIFKDNAGGIKKDIIDKIFEPYFTTKHKNIGTGLGLSMTYKIITEHHQGTIQVQNTNYEYNGKKFTGAMFILTFSKYLERDT
ncbi:MAG: PAS domain S-box protein [Arcobacteraceae bacterium]|nr:PAS domain S-box protein [Arcobacteraceae bacterium]